MGRESPVLLWPPAGAIWRGEQPRPRDGADPVRDVPRPGRKKISHPRRAQRLPRNTKRDLLGRSLIPSCNLTRLPLFVIFVSFVDDFLFRRKDAIVRRGHP